MIFKISAIEGNRQKLDGGAMFGNAPKAIWEKWLPPDAHNRIELACRSLLIETPGYKILCEVGIGAFFDPALAERYGLSEPNEHVLLRNLHALGVGEDDIDFVVLSHLHFDHAGGLLPTFRECQETGDRLHFPKAHYVVSKGAWERANFPHSRDQASFIPRILTLLKASNRLQILTGDHLPGVFEEHLSFIHTSGHTPQQQHLLLRGRNSQVFFCGDLIPGTPWLHTPITMGYDRYPELLIDEKADILSQALSEGWFLFYTHDPLVSLSRCEQDAKGRIRACEAMGELTRWEL